MVFSNCLVWFQDWVEGGEVPVLADIWDLSHWMSTEMTEATKMFVHNAFHSARARNDAIMILRALYYEYFLFQQKLVIQRLKTRPDIVERLPKLPQSNQKSAAWHAESRDMLSGHEFGPVCIGGPGEYNAVIAKKCVPPIVLKDTNAEIESRTVYLTSEDGALSAFKWGWRYEDVARQLFERCVGEGTVFDGLGRIRHPTLSRLGASPDGLIMDGPRCGRLLEIKCPPTRVIDYKVPPQYYCQMQLQAEVCDAEAVEYLEVQFRAKPQNQVTEEILTLSVKPWIGKVCVTATSADAPPESYKYAYSPLFPATKTGYKDLLAWTPDANTVLESSVWYVKDWFHKTVPRNRRWWDEVGYPSYKQFWEEALIARADGRYKTKPIFIDTDTEESDRELADIEAASDEHATAENVVSYAKRSGGWIGVESSPEPDQDTCE